MEFSLLVDLVGLGGLALLVFLDLFVPESESLAWSKKSLTFYLRTALSNLLLDFTVIVLLSFPNLEESVWSLYS